VTSNYLISYLDPSRHWLDTSGFFGGPDWIGAWLTGGGYGNYYASYDAGVSYHYSFAGWTGSGSDHISVTLYAAAIS
jgi:hypothetical protein